MPSRSLPPNKPLQLTAAAWNARAFLVDALRTSLECPAAAERPICWAARRSQFRYWKTTR